MKKENLRLYLLADFAHEKEILQALKAGIDMIQLREKNISSREYLHRACLLRTWTRQYHTLFIINDRADIAFLSDADGVHLGNDDIPPGEARKILGSQKIIGVTAKTPAQALAAQQAGADYLGCGAWFPSSTKAEAPPLQKETYADIKKTIHIPDVAIGGITSQNCQVPLELGANGLAVSAGILSADNIPTEITSFRNKLSPFIK